VNGLLRSIVCGAVATLELPLKLSTFADWPLICWPVAQLVVAFRVSTSVGLPFVPGTGFTGVILSVGQACPDSKWVQSPATAPGYQPVEVALPCALVEILPAASMLVTQSVELLSIGATCTVTAPLASGQAVPTPAR
jgi:hypothetical protein